MSKIKEPVIFRIKQADIGAFLAADTNLSPNAGSAFYKAAPAGRAGMDIKTVYGELLTNKEFLRALRIITQPDLYLVARVAGVQGMPEIRLHHKKSEGNFVAATEENAEGNLTISLFDDYESWLAWWIKGFASQNSQPAANYIPPNVSLEEFMFVLHAVDSFRRISYQNMLDHAFMDNAYVKVPSFLQSMAESLRSLDVRWLLPAFLAVTPGMEQYQTKIDSQNIGVLLEHDFFREGKLASGEDVLIFGEAGQIMGVEFLRSWFTSCGVEINVAVSGVFAAAERLFIAPTLLGNHFVRLEDADNGKAVINHQLYTAEQLLAKLDELFGGAFATDVSAVSSTLKSAQATAISSVPKGAEKSESSPRQTKTAPPPPAPKFCRNCGTKLSAGAAFCANCGAKLS
jgi:hypothetical protein